MPADVQHRVSTLIAPNQVRHLASDVTVLGAMVKAILDAYDERDRAQGKRGASSTPP